jgi:hypothetical protein
MELKLHFRKHGYKFGLTTAADYEQMADRFMFGAMNADTRECVRPAGKRRFRLDFAAAHFGVANVDPGFLLSLFPPTASMIAKHDGMLGYFTDECGRNP